MRYTAVSSLAVILLAVGNGPASALIPPTDAQQKIGVGDIVAFGASEARPTAGMRAPFTQRGAAAGRMYALDQSNKKKIGDQKYNNGLTETTAPKLDGSSKDAAKMSVKNNLSNQGLKDISVEGGGATSTKHPERSTNRK
jgi:hypothetical protein